MSGSHDDAIVILELAKWGAMIGLPDAVATIFAEDFDPDAADANDPAIRTELVFLETIATLVKHDLLDRDLLYDWLSVSSLWARVGPAAGRARVKWGVDNLFENAEALAAEQR